MPAQEVGFEMPSFQSFNFVVMQPGDKRKIAFLQSIPGRDNPVTVMKRHYFAEIQNGSKYIMCTGGLCCQYETWDNFSKTYHTQKAKSVYWVPCVYYYSDNETLMPKAGVGIIAFNYFQFQRYIEQVNSVKPDISKFFTYDITVSFAKNGQYGDYAFLRESENPALYLTNPQMKLEVEDQLKTFAQRIKDALPPEYTEVQLAEKIEIWNAYKRAKQNNGTIESNETTNLANSMVQTAQQITQTPEVVTTTIQSQPAVQSTPVQEVQPITTANPVGNEQYSLEDLAQVLSNVQEQ